MGLVNEREGRREEGDRFNERGRIGREMENILSHFQTKEIRERERERGCACLFSHSFGRFSVRRTATVKAMQTLRFLPIRWIDLAHNLWINLTHDGMRRQRLCVAASLSLSLSFLLSMI